MIYLLEQLKMINMKVIKQFPKQSKCKICGTNENKECVLVGIYGKRDGLNMEATIFHLDCIELTLYNDGEKCILAQQVYNKNEN